MNIIRNIYKSVELDSKFFNDPNKFKYDIEKEINTNTNKNICNEYELFDEYIKTKKQALYNFLYKYNDDTTTENNSCRSKKTKNTSCNMSMEIFKTSYKTLFNSDGTLQNINLDETYDKISALMTSPVNL